MRRRDWIVLAALVGSLSMAAVGCSTKEDAAKVTKETPAVTAEAEVTAQSKGDVQQITEEPAIIETEAPTPESTETPTIEPTKAPTEKPTETPKEQQKVIVIDPGHQSQGDSSLEAVAPGSSKKKKKVSSGTEGRYTKVPEYKVNLSVSKKLKKALEDLGYEVIMTRETNDVNISNIERAKVANEANADAFVRIHCNGVDNSSVHGILTLCPTKNSPYCKSIYKDSYALSKDILKELVSITGANDRGITQTDTMSGLNWSKVPVTIVEMGYMTNKEEDQKLVSDKYQDLLVQGIVNGMEKYFADK